MLTSRERRITGGDSQMAGEQNQDKRPQALLIALAHETYFGGGATAIIL
jgi:hypothetical protein